MSERSRVLLALGVFLAATACGGSGGNNPMNGRDAGPSCEAECEGLTTCESGECVPYPSCVDGVCSDPDEVCRNEVCIHRAADPDGDGVSAELDCDENDTAIAAGVLETCDGEDQDCDGRVDEGPQGEGLHYVDRDGDGYGAGEGVEGCEAAANAVLQDGDCDDDDASIHPGRAEICDTVDQNCAGGADEGACPTGCEAEIFEGHGYAFCSETLSWEDAKGHCETTGMRLVQIDSAGEDNFVSTQVGEREFGSAWLGANDLETKDRWVWDGGPQFWQGTEGGAAVPITPGEDPLRYANWAEGEPNDQDSQDNIENCGHIRAEETNWNDRVCGTLDEFVCEVAPGEPTTVGNP